MAKRMYTSVDGKARLVKKMYTGVSGVARKVKKAYVGVGGVARAFYTSGPELIYRGTVTPLSYSSKDQRGASVGEYIIIGGGRHYLQTNVTTYINSADVNAYNKSMVRTVIGSLSVARGNGACGSFNNRVMFIGGDGDTNAGKTVDTYTSDLVLSVLSPNLSIGHYRANCVSNDKYIFVMNTVSPYTNTPIAFNSNFVATSYTLPNKITKAGLTKVGKYLLVGGGTASTSSNYLNTVYAFDENLTRTTCAPLTIARSLEHNGAYTKKHALFCSGSNFFGDDTDISVCEAYNENLIQSIASNYVGSSSGVYDPDSTGYVENDKSSLALIMSRPNYVGYYDDNLIFNKFNLSGKYLEPSYFKPVSNGCEVLITQYESAGYTPTSTLHRISFV